MKYTAALLLFGRISLLCSWLLFGYAFLFGYAAPAAAEVYRWLDSEGKPHFGDRAAVPTAKKAEQLPIKSTNSSPDPEAERSRQQLRELDQFRQQQQQTQTEQAAQQREQYQQQQERCKSLQEAIRTDQETAVFFHYDNTGKRVLWTSDERLAYREKLQTTQQQHCSE